MQDVLYWLVHHSHLRQKVLCSPYTFPPSDDSLLVTEGRDASYAEERPRRRLSRLFGKPKDISMFRKATQNSNLIQVKID